jgi:hypothetical protein
MFPRGDVSLGGVAVLLLLNVFPMVMVLSAVPELHYDFAQVISTAK